MKTNKSKPPLKKPCRECPYRRNSLPGYLGENSGQPGIFIAPYWLGAVRHPCHLHINHEAPDAVRNEQYSTAPICFGFATMCKNTAKLPINSDTAKTVNQVTADHENVFSNLNEFLNHHTKNGGHND